MNFPLVILTGASGGGKTTLARYIQQRHPQDCEVFFFDSIGVPSVEQMNAKYGSGEAWQHAITLQWIKRLHPLLSAKKSVLLEGQMRIAFIQEALNINKIETAQIVLVDCDDATRIARLRIERSQPELANPTMLNWAQYLRNEARASAVEILETHQPMERCISQLESYLFITHPIKGHRAQLSNPDK